MTVAVLLFFFFAFLLLPIVFHNLLIYFKCKSFYSTLYMYCFMTIFLGLNGKQRFCLRKNREVLASFSNVILHRNIAF
jgi:hypothetical protein